MNNTTNTRTRESKSGVIIIHIGTNNKPHTHQCSSINTSASRMYLRKFSASQAARCQLGMSPAACWSPDECRLSATSTRRTLEPGACYRLCTPPSHTRTEASQTAADTQTDLDTWTNADTQTAADTCTAADIKTATTDTDNNYRHRQQLQTQTTTTGAQTTTTNTDNNYRHTDNNYRHTDNNYRHTDNSY